MIKPSVIIVIFALLLAVWLALYALTVQPYSTQSQASPGGSQRPLIEETEVMALLNTVRTDHQLRPLESHPVLEATAQQRAEALCPTGIDNHAGFIPALKASGYMYGKVNENLAQYYLTAGDLVNGWKNSSSHYQNLIDPSVYESGLGITNCGHYHIFVHWIGVPR